MDVSQTEQVASAFERIRERLGPVDLLVNNASASGPFGQSLVEITPESFARGWEVGVLGSFLCSQAFVKQAIAQGNGARVVNTTSVSGMMGNFGQSNYAAAKAGIYGLTRTMSIELQKHRITVNALAPIAKTRLTEDLPMFQGVETMTAEHISPAALLSSKSASSAAEASGEESDMPARRAA